MMPCEAQLKVAICQISGKYLCSRSAIFAPIVVIGHTNRNRNSTKLQVYINTLVSFCQMSLWFTSGSTRASAPTRWGSGPGCLSETTVTPSTCRLLSCSRMLTRLARKVEESLRGMTPSSQFSRTHLTSSAANTVDKCVNVSTFSGVSPVLELPTWPDLVCSIAVYFFSSPLVGAELLSILDETENGFIWEHIQSYAEQAHGAWLGISVKGPVSSVPLCSSKLTNLQCCKSLNASSCALCDY